jgi:SAM-dependent methyltransferase
MSSASYDQLGRGYSAARQADPRIAARINAALGNAASVLNVGAGTGSYEPRDRAVVAVEPSGLMIAQRPAGSAPVHQGSAEELPFADDSFDLAMAVLTIHHWADLESGLAEMIRVARRRIVLVTFDPDVLGKLWIVADYFPGMLRLNSDRTSAPRLAERLPAARNLALPVPRDCSDHFFAALWARPELFFDDQIVAPMWVWGRLSEEEKNAGRDRLGADLRSGGWEQRYGHLRQCQELDVGLRLTIAELA